MYVIHRANIAPPPPHTHTHTHTPPYPVACSGDRLLGSVTPCDGMAGEEVLTVGVGERGNDPNLEGTQQG